MFQSLAILAKSSNKSASMPSKPALTNATAESAAPFPISEVPRWKERREILGMSAILLPFESGGEVDWAGFRGHVQRTLDAGLVPAVNMDTGYANLIDEP